MGQFLQRSLCPACQTRGIAVFSRRYDDPAFSQALDAFYAAVGSIDHASLSGASYEVAECPNCSTIFQTSIPSDALLGQLYEVWIDPRAAFERYHQPKPAAASLWMAREMALAMSIAKSSAPRVSLDYGCGWGEWAVMARAFGFESWATELSEARRGNAIRLGAKVVDDALLPRDSFGLINLDQVLEHLPEPASCLRLLSTLLHPDGVLRISVPHSRSVRQGLRNFDQEMQRPRIGKLNAIAPLEHLNAFTQKGLLSLAAMAGLERVVPAWKHLLTTMVLPGGALRAAKALALPAYLRSSSTTQLYFRRRI